MHWIQVIKLHLLYQINILLPNQSLINIIHYILFQIQVRIQTIYFNSKKVLK